MLNPFKSNAIFVDICNEWLDFHCIEIEASTAYGYRRQIIRIKEYFKNIKIKEVDADIIQNFIRHLSDGKLSGTSINKYCRTLKLCFDFAIRKGYIADNPMDDVAIPPRRRVKIYPFSISEMDMILQQDAPDWIRNGIIISFRTGMRLGEIYALEWSDIDFDGQFIMVQRSQSRAGSLVEIKTTKTASGVRRIDIDTHLALHLLEMRENDTTGSRYVFPNSNNPDEYRIPWNISAYLRNMCRNAGIPERNFHTLRHTHASILLAHGKHPRMVQERLGHADVKTTLMTYSHVAPTLQKEAVEVFENI